MAINLNDNLPAAPAGSTNVNWQRDPSGNVSAYVTTSVELTPDNIDLTAQVADIAATNLVALPVAGVYRVSAYIIVTTPDGATSTLPAVILTWADQDNNVAQSLTMSPTNAGNLTTTYEQSDVVISVNAATAIQYSTSGYTSGTPATMQYALHIRVELL